MNLIKEKSKKLGVTIKELYTGAVIAAYSKLDLPEGRMPERFSVEFSMAATSAKVLDNSFQPVNEATLVSRVYEPCKDLTEATLAAKRAWADINGR